MNINDLNDYPIEQTEQARRELKDTVARLVTLLDDQILLANQRKELDKRPSVINSYRRVGEKNHE